MIGDVVMPTPSAVLEAAKLIADGARDEDGLGELLLVDVGGAHNRRILDCQRFTHKGGGVYGGTA